MSLQDYFENMNQQISKASVCDIGIEVLKNLEATHKAGYIYNNL